MMTHMENSGRVGGDAGKVLGISGLTAAYATHQQPFVAFKGVSLTIGEGETLGIVGESGSGKSTLALTVAGLLGLSGGFVMEGAATIDGLDLGGASERELRRLRGKSIGMIFQQPLSSLNPVQTIGRQIVEGIRLHARMSRKQARARAAELLKLMLLPEPTALLDRYPHELSGGMRQRVVIAMALANDPRLIIADEPTTALDVTVQAQVLDLLREQISSRRLACMFISHDIEVVGSIAQRVAVMYSGRMVEEGEAGGVLSRPYHPYTRGLLLASPKLVQPGSQPWLASGSAPGAGWRGCPLSPRCPLATDQCREDPPLEVTDEGRQVACWRWRDVAAMDIPAPLPPAPARDAASTRPILEVRNLSKRYLTASGVLKAVDDASFVVAQGESVAVVGESGSGKSTLARLITRLIDPSEGSVLLGDEDMAELSGRALRNKRAEVQLVFQNPTGALNPRQTIYDSLASPLRVHKKLSRAEERARIEQLLDYVALSPTLLTRYPHQLSGGQKQRVSIARALATDPSLIVCDEPLSALDVSTQAHVMSVLMDLRKRLGSSMLYISHDLGTVRALCDTVLVMYLGKILECGSVESVMDSPRHPYTQALIKASHLEGADRLGLKASASELNPIVAQAGGCRFRFRCPKAQAICATDEPQMQGDATHRVACHFAEPLDLRNVYEAREHA